MAEYCAKALVKVTSRIVLLDEAFSDIDRINHENIEDYNLFITAIVNFVVPSRWRHQLTIFNDASANHFESSHPPTISISSSHYTRFQNHLLSIRSRNRSPCQATTPIPNSLIWRPRLHPATSSKHISLAREETGICRVGQLIWRLRRGTRSTVAAQTTLLLCKYMSRSSSTNTIHSSEGSSSYFCGRCTKTDTLKFVLVPWILGSWTLMNEPQQRDTFEALF